MKLQRNNHQLQSPKPKLNGKQNDDVEGGNDFSPIYFPLNRTFIHFRSLDTERKKNKKNGAQVLILIKTNSFNVCLRKQEAKKRNEKVTDEKNQMNRGRRRQRRRLTGDCDMLCVCVCPLSAYCSMFIFDRVSTGCCFCTGSVFIVSGMRYATLQWWTCTLNIYIVRCQIPSDYYILYVCRKEKELAMKKRAKQITVTKLKYNAKSHYNLIPIPFI